MVNKIRNSRVNLKVLTVYHSHPDFSDEEKQRTNVYLTIKKPTTIDNENEIILMSIPSGTYVIAYFEIFQNEYKGAWGFLYGEWLPQSGYLLHTNIMDSEKAKNLQWTNLVFRKVYKKF